MKQIVYALQLGVSIAICFSLGAWVGYCLDSLLATTPLMMIIGIILGAFSAFGILYQGVKK